MAWTYTGNPADSDRDAVRFLIGDTDTTDEQLQDAEIDWLLTEQGSVYGAAIESARALSAKYARQVTKSVGDLKLQASDKAAHYRALVEDLEKASATSNLVPIPFAGGISVDDKNTREDETDRVEPRFHRGQFSHPDHRTFETPHGWRE